MKIHYFNGQYGVIHLFLLSCKADISKKRHKYLLLCRRHHFWPVTIQNQVMTQNEITVAVY